MMWFIIVFLGLMVFPLIFKFLSIWNYWKNKGIPYVNLAYCFFNYAENAFRRNGNDNKLEGIYAKYPNSRYIGGYQYFQPALFIRDPKLVKQITVKDFDSFSDHNTFITPDIDSLWSSHIFNMGDGWNQTRSSLSPLFTPNKLRVMLKLVDQCGNDLIDYLRTTEKKTVNVYDVMSRTSTDVLGLVMFGVTCNSHINKNNEFYVMAHKIAALDNIKGFAFWSSYFCPSLMKLLGLKVFDKNMAKFLQNIIWDSMKLRSEKQIIFPDLVHILMEMGGYFPNNQTRKHKIRISEQDMISHALLFCFAGFDTVGFVLSRLCFQLALRQDIQKKICSEIQETAQKFNGEFTYEALQSMNYLHSAILETLRFKSPSGLIDRKCVKPYLIEPDSLGEKPLYIEKGTWIWILHSGIHQDPNYYPDPEVFNPDRFHNKNKEKQIPFTFLSFGSGPRRCIAFRFAILEIKCLLVKILSNFDIVFPNSNNQESKRDGIELEFRQKEQTISGQPR